MCLGPVYCQAQTWLHSCSDCLHAHGHTVFKKIKARGVANWHAVTQCVLLTSALLTVLPNELHQLDPVGLFVFVCVFVFAFYLICDEKLTAQTTGGH